MSTTDAATTTDTTAETPIGIEPGMCHTAHLGLDVPHPLWECCDRCNYDRHRCHFCGGSTAHGSGDVHPDCAPD